ncbi:hypothetical protein [Agrobacterium tumefaciens]|uniref:hypothetical protein n=1 Tax=Agrobacterium tumefaciens TaxID=358 RepID=UPI000DD2E284|nr:hypothetical protein [Agrobacterium tumefaciens]
MGSTQAQIVIKEGELIGRRIFDKKLTSVSSLDQVPTNVFLDTRYEDDLSVDRLGNGSATKSVVSKVTELADHAATQQSTIFLGWIAAHKKHLKHVVIKPDPLTTKLDGIENPHHALIDRSSSREKALAFHFSRSLLFCFKENGEIVPPQRRSKATATDESAPPSQP